MNKQFGTLTVFLGCDETIIDNMMHQGKIQKDKGYHVYIGCLYNQRQLDKQYEFQKKIDTSLHLDDIYQKNPEIILVDSFCVSTSQQVQRDEDIHTLLEHGYDVYTYIQAKVFMQNDIQSQLFENLLFNAHHVIFLDDHHNNQQIYQIAKEKYLKWMKQNHSTLSHHDSSCHDHILVCLSSSVSCQKVIYKAFDLALSSHSHISALYVSTFHESRKSTQAQKQLQENIDLAESLGIDIEIVYAQNVIKQIIKFVQLKKISKIVVDKNMKKMLRSHVLAQLKDVDIYIVSVDEPHYFFNKKELLDIPQKDLIYSLLILIVCTLIGFIFFHFGFHDSNIIMLYILGVFFISLITASQIYSIVFSLVSVCIFNFFFTFPTLSLSVYESGYPITFLIMFIVAFMTSQLAARIQINAKFSSNIAHRTKILLETNQMLQKEISKEGIIQQSCEQLHKLLNRDIIFYSVENDELGQLFMSSHQNQQHINQCFLSNEINTAKWVMIHHQHAGASTGYLPSCQYLYLTVYIKKKVYGVVGVYLGKDRLESFEKDILLAILGEIAFALEIAEVIYEKNQSDLKAKNEKLRADLLHSISHDLRTPLTSILGQTDILMTNEECLSKSDKQKLYTNIYDDSLWLMNLVENLLSMTRIENQTIQLQHQPQIIEDIIMASLEHVSRQKAEHHIHIQLDDELLMVNIDAQLMIQVIMNIVDNAIQYTPKDSNITIHSYQKENLVYIDIYDDGYGIPDEEKEKIFEKFYSHSHGVVDGKRSMGLGLALCQSIMHAHNGMIEVLDHQPHGALFRLTLPAIKINHVSC